MANPRRKERRTVRGTAPADLSVQQLKAETKTDAIRELLNALAVRGVIDISREKETLDSILQREQVASTGIGNGIAIPHAKSKFADHFGVAVGLSNQGLEYGAHDDIPAYAVILWICPTSQTKEHLAWMRGIASIARDPNLSGKLQAVRDRKSLLNLLGEVPLEEKGK